MRIFNIFKRDIKSSLRNTMAMYMAILPLLLAVGVSFLIKDITDTSLTAVLLNDTNIEYQEYISKYAKIIKVDTEEQLYERVNKRDDTVGVININDTYQIIAEGNEAQGSVEFVQTINTLYLTNADISETNASIKTFNQEASPLKPKLANMLILLTVLLGGMLISLNIVEEKTEKTIKAINVSPSSKLDYIFGKSLIGVISTIVGVISIVLILGFNTISWLHLSMLILSVSTITVIIGLLQGSSSEDVIEAVSGVKLLMLPLGGAIAVFELLSQKWQILMYWNPFYWTYKGITEVLDGTSSLGNITLYTLITITISVLLYIAIKPKLIKGLN